MSAAPSSIQLYSPESSALWSKCSNSWAKMTFDHERGASSMSTKIDSPEKPGWKYPPIPNAPSMGYMTTSTWQLLSVSGGATPRPSL